MTKWCLSTPKTSETIMGGRKRHELWNSICTRHICFKTSKTHKKVSKFSQNNTQFLTMSKAVWTYLPKITWMKNKPTKRCFMFQVTNKMKLKAIMKYLYLPVAMKKKKNQSLTISSAGQAGEQPERSNTGEREMAQLCKMQTSRS